MFRAPAALLGLCNNSPIYKKGALQEKLRTTMLTVNKELKQVQFFLFLSFQCCYI